MILALFEPDIPQNTGSMVRLAACMGVNLHIIEPCGFPLDDKRLKRVSLDYYDLIEMKRHASWQVFIDQYQRREKKRVVLLTTHATTFYSDFEFRPDDILLFGRESAGVPQHVRDTVDACVKIPMAQGARSLNLVQAASMVLGEALRQTKGFP